MEFVHVYREMKFVGRGVKTEKKNLSSEVAQAQKANVMWVPSYASHGFESLLLRVQLRVHLGGRWLKGRGQYTTVSLS